jgi:hypothetical protein
LSSSSPSTISSSSSSSAAAAAASSAAITKKKRTIGEVIFSLLYFPFLYFTGKRLISLSLQGRYLHFT